MAAALQRILAALALMWAVTGGAQQSPASTRPWVLVNTAARTLTVIQAGAVQKVFRNISLGRGGAGPAHVLGDNRTPLGEFRIAWINPNSQFHFFFGLDYPTRAHAERARQDNLIDAETYDNIRAALNDGRLPPQDTALGGHIGIHGLGNGDPRIHSEFNWTRGCVALTNAQVDELARWIDVGTKVVIR